MVSKIKAPEGFRFKISKELSCSCASCHKMGRYNIIISLFKNDVRIGRVTLVPHNKNTYVTHSSLDDEYHNKGLGTLMYAEQFNIVLNITKEFVHREALPFMPKGFGKAKTFDRCFILERLFNIRKKNILEIVMPRGTLHKKDKPSIPKIKAPKVYHLLTIRILS